jgi:hypothetical protein
MLAAGKAIVAVLGIAVIASGADILTAFPEINGEVRPFDFRLFCHHINSSVSWRVNNPSSPVSPRGEPNHAS